MREMGPRPLEPFSASPWRRRRHGRLLLLWLACLTAWAVAIWLLVRWIW